MIHFRHLATCAALVSLLAALPLHGQVSLSTVGATYSQSFDGLANTGTSSTVPTGWAFSESGSNANTLYTAGTGSGTGGDTYSFGSTASTERAFGGLRSSSNVPTFGASFTNATGVTIGSLAISYRGEQWRFGAVRTPSPVSDRIDFQYSLNATSLTTGTWIDVDTLDFTSPINTGTTGALDGNAAANRLTITATISGLSIANASTFWIRWNDVDITSSDDGLGVDDFSLTTTQAPAVVYPTVSSINRGGSSPTNAASVTFAVTFSENVTGVSANGADFALVASGVTGASIATVSGSGSGYTVTVNTGSGSGTLGLNLSDDNSIISATSQPLGGPTTDDGDFTGQVYTIDKADPTVQSVTVPASATYTTGQDLLFTVKFNEAVTVSTAGGTPRIAITLDTGGTVNATYSSGSGTTDLVFKYTVAVGNQDTNGIAVDSLIDLNGGTLKDAATNNAALALTAMNTTGVLVSGVPLPPPLFGTPGNGSVSLAWTASSGASSYNVKRSTTSGGGYTTIGSNVSGTSYADTTVANNNTYYYVVSANGTLGESVNSNEVNVTPATSPGVVVMSQVYGGGGGSGTYQKDYVELFNRGGAPVNVGGWSLQYGSSTGNFGSISSNIYTFPAGTTIAAGKYLLVTLGSTGSGTALTADLDSANINASQSSGKIALYSLNTALGCGSTATPCTLPGTGIIDVVSWGSSNNGEGGTTINNGTGLNATQGSVRKLSGCQDTNNNLNDFTVETSAGLLTPRTSASASNVCSSPGTPAIEAPANPITTVNVNAAPFAVGLSGNDDGGAYTWGATAGTGVSSVTVSGGQGTPNATFTVTLTNGFTGTATFTASLTNSSNISTTQAVNIQVNAAGGANAAPAINTPADPVTSVSQNAAPFTVTVSGVDDGGVYNWSATAGTGVSSATVTGGQGTSTVTYTVTLTTGFNGTATFSASLSDAVNAAVTKPVNIAVTPPLAAPSSMVISQVYGGGGNSSATYTNDFVELYNPTASAIDVGGWSIQYGSATGTTWQAQPIGGVVGAGQYYLVALGTNGDTGLALPAANISGDLNLSATNGKVALVNTGEPLPSGCPAGNAALVDLVGYGTANCREGATNAPAGSNTTSLFRRNNGTTDTNVNGSDVVTGTPNPRRTAAITEIGPFVFNTDPRVSGTNAPRDANIVVTFTENVTLNTGWYSINCATSGNHDSATVAGSGRVYTIVPNATFVAGEQCTVTVFKDFVRDTDTDDSLPNTDTLPANRVWTFTVATGTDPAYASDVHLTMGNPSGATPDPNVPTNYLMQKPEFALSYNRDRGTPNWVSWHLADEWVGSLTRFDTFRADPAVPPVWYRVLGTDYSSSGFDRGHMVPNADRDKETSIPINQATFLMTNMLPQAPDNNQGPWANMENYLRTLLPANELYIVAGGAGVGGTGTNGFTTTIANGNVTVPEKTWKVVLVLPKAGGNDVSRVNAATRTIAVIMPNAQGIRSNPNDSNDWLQYLTSVNAVETLTGYDFFSNVPKALQSSFEAGLNGTNPDPVASFSISAPATVTAGVPFNVTVTARTAGNAVVSTYTGTVQFSSSASGTLPPSTTFTLADAGVKTFSVTLTSTGARTITVTDSEIVSVTGTANTTVNCPLLTVTATNSGAACNSVQLAAATSAAGPTFAWTGPGGFTSTLQNPVVNAGGVYTVTMTGVGGCTATASTTVEIFEPFVLASEAPPERTIVLGQTTTLTVAARGQNVRYQWFRNGVAFGTDSPSITVTPTSAGTHTYRVQITSACGSGTLSSKVHVLVRRSRGAR